jgi:hypothetical protein
MTRVILDIKNDEKARYIVDFLRQIDFLEIKEDIYVADEQAREKDKKNLDELFLNAPVLSEEEIQDIERVGKELRQWKIDEF